jgi:hypothetical protein
MAMAGKAKAAMMTMRLRRGTCCAAVVVTSAVKM